MSFYIRKGGVTKKINMPNTFPANKTTYSNLSSGLSSGNVQDAIDEIAKPTFTEALTRANINSGESLSTIFGKIKKWFTDLPSMFVSKSGDTVTGIIRINASSSNQLVAQRPNSGTASVWSQIVIGNDIPNGTAGCTAGTLAIYSKSQYAVNVYADENLSAPRSITLPNENGTLLVDRGYVRVVANGSKTVGTLLTELKALVDTSKITHNSSMYYGNNIYPISKLDPNNYEFSRACTYTASGGIDTINLSTCKIVGMTITPSGTSIGDLSSLVATSGLAIGLRYN